MITDPSSKRYNIITLVIYSIAIILLAVFF